MARKNEKKMMEREGYAWCNWGEHYLPATTEYFNADKNADNGIRTGYCRTCRKLHRRGIRPATPRNTFHRTIRNHGLAGICDKVIAETEAGEKVMVKAGYAGFAPDEAMIAERFAYTLGKMLGLNVNEVQIIDFGHELGLGTEYASVHYWEDEFTQAMDMPTGTINRDHPDRLKMKFLDDLLYNGDRHYGNWGELNGRVFMIDHGHARPWDGQFQPISYDTKYNIEEVPEVMKMAKRFLKFTKQDFVSMLSGLDEIPYATERVAKVIKRMIAAQDELRTILAELEVAA